MDIGTRLKELRRNKGYKQNEVAGILGLNKTSYNKIENNNRSLNVNELREISALYQVDPKLILDNEKEDPIITYMKKSEDLTQDAEKELNKVLQMIDDAYGQFKLYRGDV